MSDSKFNQPLGGNEMPRFGGIATMMRLPQADSPADLDKQRDFDQRHDQKQQKQAHFILSHP